MIEARGQPAGIRRAYGLFSRFYRLAVSRLERPAIERGIERAAIQPGERVLEVAVGPGVALERIARIVGDLGLVFGVDITPGMLAAARGRIPEAHLVRADARSLPFPSGAFDLVWSSYFLDLVPTAELTPVLAEFHRVLRPGGRLLLVNFSKEDEKLMLWERLYRLTPAPLVAYCFGGCRPVQAEPFVRAAGFSDVRREFLPHGMQSEIITARK